MLRNRNCKVFQVIFLMFRNFFLLFLNLLLELDLFWLLIFWNIAFHIVHICLNQHLFCFWAFTNHHFNLFFQITFSTLALYFYIGRKFQVIHCRSSFYTASQDVVLRGSIITLDSNLEFHVYTYQITLTTCPQAKRLVPRVRAGFLGHKTFSLCLLPLRAQVLFTTESVNFLASPCRLLFQFQLSL